MKKIFGALGIFMLVLLAAAACIVLNGQFFPSDDDIGEQKNNAWMDYIKDDALLTDIVMPGSHDAGTCNINYLARTQGYSVKEQLDMGARYFDLRVNKTEDGYYMYHAMFNGEKFENVLSAITEFIKNNPGEALILDFQHFSGGAEEDVVSMLESGLVADGLAIHNDTDKSDLEFISGLTLGDCRGKCVMLFGGDEELALAKDFLFARNNDECTKTGQSLNSCYISEYNKMLSEDFINTALPYYYQNIEKKIEEEGFKGLFVLQGQLTDGLLIFGPYAREKTHRENMSEYIRGIKNDSQRLAITNIIMRDFLTSDKCEEIISLNFDKGLVKEEYKTEFDRIYK